jgi:hypothetical protein
MISSEIGGAGHSARSAITFGFAGSSWARTPAAVGIAHPTTDVHPFRSGVRREAFRLMAYRRRAAGRAVGDGGPHVPSCPHAHEVNRAVLDFHGLGG